MDNICANCKHYNENLWVFVDHDRVLENDEKEYHCEELGTFRKKDETCENFMLKE